MNRTKPSHQPCSKDGVTAKRLVETLCTYLLTLHVPGGHKNANIPIREISAEFFCSQ